MSNSRTPAKSYGNSSTDTGTPPPAKTPGFFRQLFSLQKAPLPPRDSRHVGGELEHGQETGTATSTNSAMSPALHQSTTTPNGFPRLPESVNLSPRGLPGYATNLSGAPVPSFAGGSGIRSSYGSHNIAPRALDAGEEPGSAWAAGSRSITGKKRSLVSAQPRDGAGSKLVSLRANSSSAPAGNHQSMSQPIRRRKVRVRAVWAPRHSQSRGERWNHEKLARLVNEEKKRSRSIFQSESFEGPRLVRNPQYLNHPSRLPASRQRDGDDDLGYEGTIEHYEQRVEEPAMKRRRSTYNNDASPAGTPVPPLALQNGPNPIPEKEDEEDAATASKDNMKYIESLPTVKPKLPISATGPWSFGSPDRIIDFDNQESSSNRDTEYASKAGIIKIQSEFLVPVDKATKAADSVEVGRLLVYDKEEYERKLMTAKARTTEVSSYETDDMVKIEPWECAKCQKKNDDNDASKCSHCNAPRSSKVVTSSWGTNMFRTNSGWRCSGCFITNANTLGACASCETLREGSTPTTANAAAAGNSGVVPSAGVSSGATVPKTNPNSAITANGFTFAVASASTATAPAPATNGGGFGAITFGSHPAPDTSKESSTPAVTGGSFKFDGFGGGGSTKEADGPALSKSKPAGFTFGQPPAAKSPSDASESAPKFSFGVGATTAGALASTPAPAPGAFQFGASSTKEESKATGGFSSIAQEKNPSAQSSAAPSFTFGSTPASKGGESVVRVPAVTVGNGATLFGTSFGSTASATTFSGPSSSDTVPAKSTFVFAAKAPENSLGSIPSATSNEDGKRKKRRGGAEESNASLSNSGKIINGAADFAASVTPPLRGTQTDSTFTAPLGLPSDDKKSGTPDFTFNGTSQSAALPPSTTALEGGFGGTAVPVTAGAASFSAPTAPAPFSGFAASTPAAALVPPANPPTGVAFVFGSTPAAPAPSITPAPAPATGAAPFQFGAGSAAPSTQFGASSTAPGQSAGASMFAPSTQAPTFGAPAPPSFAAPTAAPPAAMGSSGFPPFGSSAPAAPSFGYHAGSVGMQAPAPAPGFGAPSAPASFGAPPAAGFGAAAAATGGFGQPPSQGFGQTPVPQAAPTAPSFGQPPVQGGFQGGGFGQQPPAAAGGGGFQMGASTNRSKRRIVKARRPGRQA